MLLIRDSRGAYHQSIYLDDHGEEDARELNERERQTDKGIYDSTAI